MDTTRWTIYSLLVIVGILGAVGDIAVNQWAKSWQLPWWFASCVIWVLAATLFGVILHEKYFTFGIAVVLALLVHSVLALGWDFFWEHTKLTPLQWLGLFCALVAFCCFELGKKPTNNHPVTTAIEKE